MLCDMSLLVCYGTFAAVKGGLVVMLCDMSPFVY